METIGLAMVTLALLLLLAYFKSGRTRRIFKRMACLSAAASAVILLLLLGIMPRVVAYNGCTAYVLEGSGVHVEDRCPTM